MTHVTKENGIKHYKVFNKDLKCNNMQYEIGKDYHLQDDNGIPILPIVCKQGFHACMNINDCWAYYEFTPVNRVCIVLLYNDIDDKEKDKICASSISILEEIRWEKVLQLCNSGNWNTGYGNNGDSNTGNCNSGNWNTGYDNNGDNNTGNWNSGYRNTGCGNTNNRNTGNWNSGYGNSGNGNSGKANTGDCNSGNGNIGNRNTGNWNSGDRNSGNWNSGDWNSGDRNSGNWNSGDMNSGHFNTISPLYVFNTLCDRTTWDNAIKPNFIYFDLCIEKTLKEGWQNAFKTATAKDIVLLKALPNFNKDVFFEISGIMIE